MKRTYTKTIVIAFLATLLSNFSCFAQNWKYGDTFTQEGITYKVVAFCLLTDSRDTLTNASTFYEAGELMVTNVSNALTDVVIPVAVGRYKVIGLTDSLFYGRTLNRVWLPELEFIGNAAFENAKINSGSLVVHNVRQVGENVFLNIDARLCFDISAPISYYIAPKNDSIPTKTYTKKQQQPKGGVVCHVKTIGKLASSPYFGYEIAGQNKFFNKCVAEAYNDDKEWIDRPLATRFTDLRYCKRNFSTTPSGIQKGFDVRISVILSQKMARDFPWGRLTDEYGKQTFYNAYDKKSHKTGKYDTFRPETDPKQKEGWILVFGNEDGEVKYTLKGKQIKK